MDDNAGGSTIGTDVQILIRRTPVKHGIVARLAIEEASTSFRAAHVNAQCVVRLSVRIPVGRFSRVGALTADHGSRPSLKASLFLSSLLSCPSFLLGICDTLSGFG